MKLKEFLKQIENLNQELLEKEVVGVAQNGLLAEPHIRFQLKDKYAVDHSSDNVEKIVIYWE